MEIEQMKYPKRMITAHPDGKIAWTKDGGRVGAYQPSAAFDSEGITHSVEDCRNIRNEYRADMRGEMS